MAPVAQPIPQTRTVVRPAVNGLKRLSRDSEGKIARKSAFGGRDGQQILRSNGKEYQGLALPLKAENCFRKEIGGGLRNHIASLPSASWVAAALALALAGSVSIMPSLAIFSAASSAMRLSMAESGMAPMPWSLHGLA